MSSTTPPCRSTTAWSFARGNGNKRSKRGGYKLSRPLGTIGLATPAQPGKSPPLCLGPYRKRMVAMSCRRLLRMFWETTRLPSDPWKETTSESSWAPWTPPPAPPSYPTGKTRLNPVFGRELQEQVQLPLRPGAVAHGIKLQSPPPPPPPAAVARKRRATRIPNTPRPPSPLLPRSPTPAAVPAHMSRVDLQKSTLGPPREHPGAGTAPVLTYDRRTA